MASIQTLLSARMKQLRATRDMSQEALAEKSGRSIEAISNIERGKASPTLETLQQLAAALGVKVVDLLSEQNSGPNEEAVTKLVAAARSLKAKDLAVAVATIEALAGRRR
jgi:transcriptional regulator with XRE-family HTH domain